MKPAPPVTSTPIGYSPSSLENGARSSSIGSLRSFSDKIASGAATGHSIPNFQISPVNPAVMSGRIDLIDLVENDRIGLERAKAMGEAGRNEELLVALTAQLYGNVPSKAW